MKPLEDDFRSHLRRKEPPEDFAARVLERIKHAPKRPSLLRRFLDAFSKPPGLRWATAAALAIVLAGAGYARYRQQRVRKGEMARAEVMLALRITSAQLNMTFKRALLNRPIGSAGAEKQNSER